MGGNDAQNNLQQPNPHEKADTLAVLKDLPTTASGFSQFDPNLQPDSFRTYLSSASDVAPTCRAIKTEKTRCLIRALKAMSTSELTTKKRTLSAAGSTGNPEPAKRARWSGLPKEQKQACLRIALAAACAHESSGALQRLRTGWAEDPRRKQLVNGEVRRAICQSVEFWGLDELNDYMSKGGIPVSSAMRRPEIIRAVREHLAPSERDPLARK